jgi:hypothetical protein
MSITKQQIWQIVKDINADLIEEPLFAGIDAVDNDGVKRNIYDYNPGKTLPTVKANPHEIRDDILLNHLIPHLSADDMHFTTSSTTEMTIGIQENLSLLVDPGLEYIAGQYVIIAINDYTKMFGDVVSYNRDTGDMVVNITYSVGFGTYSQWLVSLSGGPGIDGAQGIRGPKGDKGDKGDRGPRGFDGEDGASGAQGPSGLPGEDGASGLPGEDGVSGAQGPIGPQGASGLPGEDGASGLPGDRWTTSANAEFTLGVPTIPGDRWTTSSTTELDIAFYCTPPSIMVESGLAYIPGQEITITYDEANEIYANVVSYDKLTGEMFVDFVTYIGGGTYSVWRVALKENYTTSAADTIDIGGLSAGEVINLNVDIGLAYTPGQYVVISYDALNKIYGLIESYNRVGGNLTIIQIAVAGSGSYSQWNISLREYPSLFTNKWTTSASNEITIESFPVSAIELNVQPNLAYVVDQNVIASVSADILIHGDTSYYNSGNGDLFIDQSSCVGVGNTFSAWNVSVETLPGILGDRFSTSASDLLTPFNYDVGDSLSITVDIGLSYIPGQTIIVSHDALTKIYCNIASYNKNTGVLSAYVIYPSEFSGYGTYDSWAVVLDRWTTLTDSEYTLEEISPGNVLSFNTSAGLAYVSGQSVRVEYGLSQIIYGTVVSFTNNPGGLTGGVTLTVTSVVGTGTYSLGMVYVGGTPWLTEEQWTDGLFHPDTNVYVSAGQSLSFYIEPGLAYIPGQDVVIAVDNDHKIYGSVVSYNKSTGAVVVLVTSTVGVGTYSTWRMSIGGSGGGSSTGDKFTTSATDLIDIDTLSAGQSLTITVDTGLSYIPGQVVVIAFDANNKIYAVVNSYSSTTGAMTLTVLSFTGSGSHSAWLVSLSADPNPACNGIIPGGTISLAFRFYTYGNRITIEKSVDAYQTWEDLHQGWEDL